jgi:Tfp pilus assembly protein PilE
MGQQQLLLIVLGVIIVGIAIAVGISMFKSSAVDANRSAVSSDLTNLASKAQRYYRTPVELGGGGQNFKDFALARLILAMQMVVIVFPQLNRMSSRLCSW